MSMKDIVSGQPSFELKVPTAEDYMRRRKKVYEVIVRHEVVASDSMEALSKIYRPQDPEIRVTQFTIEPLGTLAEK